MNSTRHKVMISFCLIMSIWIFTSIMTSYVLADEINPGVYSADSKPFGISYENWTARWWQWVHNVPPDQNVNFDSTGEFCHVGQEGPVWFLGPSFGEQYERSCTIPSDKAILFPVNTGECDYISSPDAKTPEDLSDCASEGNKGGIMRASVDGISLKNLEAYRVTSPLFNITIPENNVFGSPAGTSGAIADGFWVFLEPLSSGQHEVSFAVNVLDDPATPTTDESYSTDIIYNVTVK
jgi:hypothetical protein